MEYLSAKEASEKWGMNLRTVQRLCKEGQIPGAKKYGVGWLLPSTLQKPADRRRTGRRTRYLGCGAVASSVPMPKINPDSVIDTLHTKCVCRQYEEEISYLRGDFDRAIRCFLNSDITESTYLCSALITMEAAVNSGDYETYTETADAVRSLCSVADDVTKRIADMNMSLLMLDAKLPELVPVWIRDGDSSKLPPESRHMMVYLFSKYMLTKGLYSELVAVCRASHILSIRENSFTAIDIYMGIICAVGFHNLSLTEQRDYALMFSANLALPNSFITPFAEFFPEMGETMETLFNDKWPEQFKKISEQSKRISEFRKDFHNRLVRENITKILSPQEYSVAEIIAHGSSLKNVSGKTGISPKAVKSIVSNIYLKLNISKKSEIAAYIV